MKSRNKFFTCLAIFSLFSLPAFSQGVVLRAGYAYSPEDGLLIFPPVHLSLEYQLAKEYNTCYFGACTGGGIIMSAWGGIGAYWGYKYHSFIIENKANCYIEFPFNPEDQPDVKTITQFSINPKIGFETRHFYIKAGPYIPINPRQEGLLNVLKYPQIGNTIIDLELGYRIRFDTR